MSIAFDAISAGFIISLPGRAMTLFPVYCLLSLFSQHCKSTQGRTDKGHDQKQVVKSSYWKRLCNGTDTDTDRVAVPVWSGRRRGAASVDDVTLRRRGRSHFDKHFLRDGLSGNEIIKGKGKRTAGFPGGRVRAGATDECKLDREFIRDGHRVHGFAASVADCEPIEYFRPRAIGRIAGRHIFDEQSAGRVFDLFIDGEIYGLAGDGGPVLIGTGLSGNGSKASSKSKTSSKSKSGRKIENGLFCVHMK